MSQTVPNVAGSQGQWQTIELRNLEFKKKHGRDRRGRMMDLQLIQS